MVSKGKYLPYNNSAEHFYVLVVQYLRCNFSPEPLFKGVEDLNLRPSMIMFAILLLALLRLLDHPVPCMVAMREQIQELKAEAGSKVKVIEVLGERAVLSKVEQMPEPDRSMAERLHRLIMSCSPDLTPRLWYGMPAYTKDGQIICFFQPASKFKARYGTLGFSDKARLDDGAMWPTTFALEELGVKEEKKVAELVRRALSGSKTPPVVARNKL
ncbi:MAG: DUF1801 domain-containing protein [Candidatus Parvarchaeota archaeon]